MSVASGERPFGRSGGVVCFRQRDGFNLWLDGEATDGSGLGRWGLRGTWEIALGRGVGKGGYNGKIVAYMKATTGECDTLGGEIGLLLEDVFANVLEGDLGRRKVLREAVHEGEREGRRGKGMERE